ncbi:MAG: type III pantothenate kinase [Chloroflexota bacterium]
MLLAIDIGNTNITLGVFREEKLHATWRVATSIRSMADEYSILLLSLLRQQGIKLEDITQVSLCSVVPTLTMVFEELVRRYFHLEPLVVGAGTRTGVRIRMDNPREVGADRIVDAAAAHHLYKGPVIIVDLGTAATFDTVSREGEYLGGAIAPGISTGAEALFTRAAMLPRVELSRPKNAIGTNTIDAMRSGLIFGYVGLVEGIIARIQAELKEKAFVAATGGYAAIIAQETPVIEAVNPDLTLIGLRLIYLMNLA